MDFTEADQIAVHYIDEAINYFEAEGYHRQSNCLHKALDLLALYFKALFQGEAQYAP